MYVIDIAKGNLAVGISMVRSTVLKASPFELICPSIEQRSRVKDLNETCDVSYRAIALANASNQVLIPATPQSEE